MPGGPSLRSDRVSPNRWTIALAAIVGLAALAALVLMAEAGGLPLAGGAMASLGGWLPVRRRDLEADSGGDERPGFDAAGLLADIEARERSWFWQTDAEGLITYLTPQLAARIGATPEALRGTPFIQLFIPEEGQGASRPSERTIDFHMKGELAFEDVAVQPIHLEGVCWSLCGSPVFDPKGRFRGFRGTGADRSEEDKSRDEVVRMAKFDALTGLPNRRYMRETLESALRKKGGQRPDCALFLLDLDRFKSVNDTLGHPVGDALLQQVAQRLTRVVGDKGRVGRLGGDEFNVVLPDIDSRSELARLADAIISRLSLPYVIDDSTLSIGASVGIAISPFDGECPDELVRNADLALYAAKGAGKGVHRFYQPEMHADAKDRRLLEVDLREVLNGNELYLEYQPIVDATTEEIEGFEALVRWQHPVRGAVSPTGFIPIAEEIGLIPRIGEWVIRTACAEAANWPEHLRLAVNLSPLQFASPGLPALIMNALGESGLSPERLELELTESVFLNESSSTDSMFATLKGIGVRLALDDFGTGYASLANLQRAAFDKIKIDQSFVRGAAVEGSRNAAIIRAIVALAQSLNIETTAEGAETPHQVELIRSLGCSQIQGYIFGRPMSGEEATARARKMSASQARTFVEREPRVAVLRFANLISEGRSYPVRIRNLASGGAMIEIDEDVPLGSAFDIEFSAQRRVGAQLRWVKGRRLGAAFDRQIDVEQVTQAVSLAAMKTPKGAPEPGEDAELQALRQANKAPRGR